MDKSVIRSDVLVVGQGVAGLRCALGCMEAGLNTVIVSKGPFGQSHSVMAEGGVNAVFERSSSDDSVGRHISDTLTAGRFINNLRCVEQMCRLAGPEIMRLVHRGASIPMGKDGFPITGAGPSGGQTKERVVATGDFIGSTISRALLIECINCKPTVLSFHFLVSLLKTEGGDVVGALLLDCVTGALVEVAAPAVVLATGGAAGLYVPSTNGLDVTGEGLLVAYHAGAQLKDLEMIQFHPTGLGVRGRSRGLLISEAARGIGAYLVDETGYRFMADFDPTRMELATRDVVSCAMHSWKERTGRQVFLSFQHLDPSMVHARLPNAARLVRETAGLSLHRDRIPVEPTAHYTMGGIAVRDETFRVVEGLYAIGECGWGVHGANRLGGNSLADCLVAGAVSAEAVRSDLKRNRPARNGQGKPASGGLVEVAYAHSTARSTAGDLVHVRKRLGETLASLVGVERDANTLSQAASSIDDQRGECADVMRKSAHGLSPRAALEGTMALELASLIVKAARARCESRGAHRRRDHPAERSELRASTVTMPGSTVTFSRVGLPADGFGEQGADEAS